MVMVYLNEFSSCDGLRDNERFSESGNRLKIWNEVTTILSFGMTVSKDKVDNIRANLVIILAVSSESSLTLNAERHDK